MFILTILSLIFYIVAQSIFIFFEVIYRFVLVIINFKILIESKNGLVLC